jgi:hypothetical protein
LPDGFFLYEWLISDTSVSRVAAPDRARIGIEVTGQSLITAGDNHHRMRSEGCFAMLV